MKQMSRTILVLGFALFAMFFGAGNLIFPPALGRIFGESYPAAILGFLLTGVGLPFMGILAVARAEGGIDRIAGKVDPRIGTALSLTIMLAIGPFLAIPRTCATTFELGIAPNAGFIGLLPFSVVFFSVVLFLALNPLSVIDRIGQILTPALLLALLALIVKGFLSPIGVLALSTKPNPFGVSVVEGYQTMDLMGSVILGIIILNELQSKGIFDRGRQLKAIVAAGAIAAGCLALVYGGLLYLGATTSAVGSTMTRTETLLFISRSLFGNLGGVVLGVAVSMACLTTALALTVVCGEYFNKISRGKINYRLACVAVCLASLVFANAGLEQIIRLAVPPLVSLYPVVIVLVLLSLFGGRIENRNVWRGAVLGAFLSGLATAARTAAPESASLDSIHDLLPFTEHGLGWVLPAAALGFLGALIREKKKERFRVLVIYPSQLSTRVAIFDNRDPIYRTAIEHCIDRAMSGAERDEQFAFMEGELQKRLAGENIDMDSVDAVVARGGFLYPVEGGVYRINERMLSDLASNASRHHPSNWGPAMASRIAAHHGIQAFVVDPVVVDEMSEVAHMSGLPDVRRASIFHASNQKAVCRRVAQNLWKRHDKINAIIAHMGEGTSVAAHAKGRVIDVNNALDGDGPFSALTAGSLPAVSVVDMCFEENSDREEILTRIRSRGGLRAYLNTTDAEVVNRMIEEGDGDAIRVIEAMAYQVAKEIGQMAAALSGRVDAIALTGELAGCRRLVSIIRERVRFLAPTFVFPEESETQGLVVGALRALRKEEGVLEYMPPEPSPA